MDLIQQAINNLTFDAKIRAQAAFSALNHVDALIADFKLREGKSQADILLDVFGLLQGLFVGIDGMYQLSFAATKYKYHININSNKALKELKYLRNDVVGHPTNRNYDDGSFGFSIILNDEITRDKLSYITYIIKGKDIILDKHAVYFDELLKAYEQEKAIFIRDLNAYLRRNPSKIQSSGLIVQLFEKAAKHNFDFNLLESIKKLFLSEQNLFHDTRNRFIWRIHLVKTLFEWKDEAYQDVIHYITLNQILSIYQMNQDLNNDKLRMPKISLPTLIQSFDSWVEKHPESNRLINYLNDSDHPLFKADLDQLIDQVTSKDLKTFLSWFKELRNLDHKFLVGQLLKQASKRIVL